MVDERRRGLFGKTLCLAVATVSGGVLLGAANLPLARAATSSSSSGGVPDSACSGVAERCAADPFCTGCTTGIGSRRRERSRRRLQQQSGDDDADDDSEQQQQQQEEVSTELCSSRYPILVSGSGISFCERVGAAKCCEFSDNDAAVACMDDPLSAEYWGCFLMDEVSCDISDMPCHASHRLTPSPMAASPTAAPVLATASPTALQTPAPTAAPTAAAATAAPTTAPTVAAADAATPSPTAGSRGGLDIPTPAPTAGFDADDGDGVDIDAGGGETNGAVGRMFSRRGTTTRTTMMAAVLAGAVGGGVAAACLSGGCSLGGVPFFEQF